MSGTDNLGAHTPAKTNGVELPSYLKQVLEHLRQHEEELLASFDAIAAERQTRHTNTSAQLLATEQELFQLRQRVAQQQLELQEERERSTRLLHENTTLFTQEAQLREQVAKLTALAHERGKQAGGKASSPSAASTSARVGQAPVESYSLRAVSGRDGLRGRPSHLGGDVDLAAVADDVELLQASCPSQANLASHALAITEEVQMLREQLDAQRSMYERERAQRLSEERESHRQHLQDVEGYTTTIHHLEALHEQALRDLTTYRHRTDATLTKAEAETRWLKQALDEAMRTAEQTNRGHQEQLTLATQQATQRLRPRLQLLSTELRRRQNAATADREGLQHTIEAKDRRIRDLEAQLSTSHTRGQREEQRHRLELEGVRNELAMMRQSLREMEKRVYFRHLRAAAAQREERALVEEYFAM